MQWSEEAAQKRDECLAGELPFDEFVIWLEQGRIRRGRNKPPETGKPAVEENLVEVKIDK